MQQTDQTSDSRRENSIVSCCVWSFIFPVLEYCSQVWMSAAVSHCLIGSFRVYLGLSGGVVHCDLWFCWSFGGAAISISCSRLVVLPTIILLCTPSLLCVLDVAPRSTCVRLFLLVFRYGIFLMSRTLLRWFGSLQDTRESYP